MPIINPMDRIQYGVSLVEACKDYILMYPTCFWAFPTTELNIVGEKGFEEWWDADNGWWYILTDHLYMTSTTICIPYWGA